MHYSQPAKAVNGIVDGVKTVANKGSIGQLKEKANKHLNTIKDKLHTKIDEVKCQLCQMGTPPLELAGVNVGRITDTGTVGKNKPSSNPKPSNSSKPPAKDSKPPEATKGTGKIEGMPPLVQSRVNLRNGSAAEGAGFNHVLDRHFNPSKNASQFSITPDELKGVLQSKEVVNTPVSRVLYSDIKLADGTIEKQARYVREVTLDSNIGIDKFSGSPTNIMTVLTDKYGNLVTTTPGVIK
jgi:hypothetical protein